MPHLPQTEIIEGNYEDYQFCAEKIFAYANQIGHKCDAVRVTYRGGHEARIVIVVFTPGNEAIATESFAKFDDMIEILSVGYTRAAAMLSGFHVKN